MGQRHQRAKAKLHSINAALERGGLQEVKRTINIGLAPAEVAHLIESSPPKVRKMLWELVETENEGEVLQHLSDEISADFLNEMSTEQLVDLTSELDTDDVVDLLQQLPEQQSNDVLRGMDSENRSRLEAVLCYPEDSAGGLMNTDTVTVRADVTLDVVLRYLRRHRSLPEMTDNLYVINRSHEFIGTLPINKLLVSDLNQTVREVMTTDTQIIHASLDEEDVAKIFERHDLVSAPVIDNHGKLIGRITIDDVVDVIRDTADHSMMSMAGLDEEEDTFAPAFKTGRRRAIWLGINLITAFIASAVIGLFSDTIERLVALAVLMPIVASMGGIAGSQVLTLVIRGQALGHISSGNIGWLLNRELAVGFFNGLLWAAVIAGITLFWFNDALLAGIIAAAIIINLVVAVLSGAALPIILKRQRIDPALAGGVILTTITDVVGFFLLLRFSQYTLFIKGSFIMAKKKKDPFAEEIEYEIVSKSEMKRDMIELQELGERIVALPRKKAMELPLSEMMKAAVRETERVGKNEAMRRHMQYIGRLIRSEDIEGIREALDLLDPSTEAYGRVTGQQEQWRTRLISDPDAIVEFIEQFPSVNRQHLRTLIRNAAKEMSTEPPKAGSNYKNLFQAIKEQYNLKDD